MKPTIFPLLLLLAGMLACSPGEDLPEPIFPQKYVYDRYEVDEPTAFRWETGGYVPVEVEPSLTTLKTFIEDLPSYLEWPIAGVELLTDSTGLVDLQDTAYDHFELIPFKYRQIDEQRIQLQIEDGSTLTFGTQEAGEEVDVCFLTYFYVYYNDWISTREFSPVETEHCFTRSTEAALDSILLRHSDDLVLGDTLGVLFSRMIYRLE